MAEFEQASVAATAYPLHRPLPPDVMAHAASWPLGYRNYPVFSAPWYCRRMALFAACATAVAVLQAAGVWRLVDNRTAAIFTAGNVLAWLLIVTVGPSLATLVRHRRLSAKKERVGLVLAVMVGFASSAAAQHAATRMTNEYLMPRAIAAGTIAKPVKTPPSPYYRAGIFAWMATVFLAVGGGPALRAYFIEQQRFRKIRHERELEMLRKQKSDAELKLTVLQAQVEPHFLFNTLASVHSLIRADAPRAEATIEALVDHLRATLPKLRAGVGTAHSTLAEQLEVCASYLAVMQVRMGERLRFALDVPAPLRTHPFPPLMLISLVENAIKHGVEPSAPGGTITIRAAETLEREERKLAVSVIDDGVGLRPGLGEGVGLANLRAQLAAQFGARGHFSIQGRSQGGVIATLVVPFVEAAT